MDEEDDEDNEASLEYQKLAGRKLRNEQVAGLYIKRWHNVKRSPKAICSQIFLPPLFIFLGSLIALLLTPKSSEEPLKLLTIYTINNPRGPYMFTAETSKDENLTDLQKVLLTYPHHSFRCIKGNCFLVSRDKVSPFVYTKQLVKYISDLTPLPPPPPPPLQINCIIS